LPAANHDGSLNFGVIFFVVSFVVIVNWTLLQVRLCSSWDHSQPNAQFLGSNGLLWQNETMRGKNSSIMQGRLMHIVLVPAVPTP
jgi:hypothetical protein